MLSRCVTNFAEPSVSGFGCAKLLGLGLSVHGGFGCFPQSELAGS